MKRRFSGFLFTFLLMPVLALGLDIQPIGLTSQVFVYERGIDLSNYVPEWSETYGGDLSELAYSSIQTADGGYMIAARTCSFAIGKWDFWVLKINAYGEVQWNKTYGGAGDDLLYSIIQTVDGGYALAGYTYTLGNLSDWWLVKIDSDGEMEWNHTYGGISDESAFSVIQTSDNGYALCGFTRSFGYWDEAWLVKTDMNGSMQWNKKYRYIGSSDGWGFEFFQSVIQTADDGFVLGGWTDCGTGTASGPGNCDFWLVKTDLEGNMLWNKTYGGAGADKALWAIATSDEGYALAGYTNSTGAGKRDFWLVKTDSDGEMLWNRTYGGTGYEMTRCFVETPDGGYALVGVTTSFAAGMYDYWMVRTGMYGEMYWNMTYGGSDYEAALGVILTSDGGYFLTGHNQPYPGSEQGNCWLIKLGPEAHDLAGAVEISKTVVFQNFSLAMNITVFNEGHYPETINASVYVNETMIFSMESFHLATRSLRSSATIWNSSGFKKGNHTVYVDVPLALNESETRDNTMEVWIIISMIGDITGPDGWPDGKCDMRDVGLVARYFGETVPLAPANCDVTGPTSGVPDGRIDMRDVGLVARHFGETDP